MLRADLQEERSAAQRQGPVGGGAGLLCRLGMVVEEASGAALAEALRVRVLLRAMK